MWVPRIHLGELVRASTQRRQLRRFDVVQPAVERARQRRLQNHLEPFSARKFVKPFSNPVYGTAAERVGGNLYGSKNFRTENGSCRDQQIGIDWRVRPQVGMHLGELIRASAQRRQLRRLDVVQPGVERALGLGVWALGLGDMG